MLNDLPEFLDRRRYKEAMNEALAMSPGRTAIVTIDMQRKYLDETVGDSVVLPEEADRVLKRSKKLLDFGRSQGIPIIHAYVTRRPEEFGPGFHCGGPAYLRKTVETGGSQLPHRHVRYQADRMVGSAQAEIPGALLGPSDVHVATKKSLDGFQHTDLGFLLARVFDVQTVVFAGINTDTCVYSTAFTAANQGFEPIVIADCVASMRGKDSHWMALELMSRSIAWVLTLDEFVHKTKGKASDGRRASSRGIQPGSDSPVVDPATLDNRK